MRKNEYVSPCTEVCAVQGTRNLLLGMSDGETQDVGVHTGTGKDADEALVKEGGWDDIWEEESLAFP